MTDGYDCYQNALAEWINGIIKNEFLVTKPINIEQARLMIKEAVNIYNHLRPHLALTIKHRNLYINKKSLPVLTNKDYL